jgi:uncharacterized protein YtpQ (UPF0354 family)
MTDDAAPVEPTAVTAADHAAGPVSLTPEHSWEAAAPILYPVLRPAGTHGLHLAGITTPASAAGNVEPLLDDGPADLLVAFALAATGFDVLANGDHLAAWSVSPAALREAAYANLGAWSAAAPWSVDTSDQRRVISSDTGDGWDASRILLPDVITHLAGELGGPGIRILIGLPARHLLVAGRLNAEDPEFAMLFADFVLEYAGDSDEAIDRRLFELREGRLVPFDATNPA